MTSKMRAFLTMLGIIIGVAAVIILVSLVDGFKNTLVNEFSELGANTITVNIRSRGSTRTVDTEDMIALCEKHDDVFIGVTPSVSVQNASPKIGTEDLSSTVTGASEGYADVKGSTLSAGRFLSYSDVQTRQKVCVVGSYINEEFFFGDAVGKTLKISGNTFEIVGVFEESAQSKKNSADDTIVVPYTTLRTVSPNSTVTSYTFAAISDAKSAEAQQIIENYLLEIFQDDSLYTVINMTQLLDIMDELTGRLSAILAGIAAISLLVGGIGIMNIMLVSVTERTKEIGIRKSLGARRFDIMSQFVVEAATTSAIGGIVGIILGIIFSYILGNALGLITTPSVGAIILSFSFSAAIGILFGYFPARKAAKLNPIDALRYD